MKDSKEIGQQIVAEAALYIRSSQRAIKEEQATLLQDITRLLESGSHDMTLDLIPGLVLKKIEDEILAATALDEAIKTNAQNKFTPHFGIKYNKLKTILEGVKELATDENISRILDGKLPLNYDNSIGDLLPTLGKEGAFWGTSEPTFLSTLLQLVHNVISSESLQTEESPIFHTFTCPDAFDTTDIVQSLFVDSGTNPVKINIPHSGYSFGGDRASDKKFKPQDCTSFIETCMQIKPSSASSVDLYLVKRTLNGQPLVVVNEDWLKSEGGLNTKLFSLNVGNPLPGDIWCVRKFSEAKSNESSFGFSGHAGIYLGREKDEIVTLAYNRDMPKIEGCGLERRAFEDNSSIREQFYLTRNDSSFDEQEDFAIFPYTVLGDLRGLTLHTDRIIDSEEPEIDLTGEDA